MNEQETVTALANMWARAVDQRLREVVEAEKIVIKTDLLSTIRELGYTLKEESIMSGTGISYTILKFERPIYTFYVYSQYSIEEHCIIVKSSDISLVPNPRPIDQGQSP